MKQFRPWGLGLALSLVLGACSAQTASPTPSSAPPSGATVVATATSAPVATATSAPATATEAPPTATAVPPTAVPTVAATATTAAATTGSSAKDLLAKLVATAPKEFSADIKITTSGSNPTVSNGKEYKKGSKTRYDMTVKSYQSTTIIDQDAKVMYSIFDIQGVKQARKISLDNPAAQNASPADNFQKFAAGAKVTGTDTVDGKPATIIEIPSTSGGPTKIWIWVEHSVPLKLEVSANSGTVDWEFLNYHFDSQPDSLFELPAGVKVVDTSSFGGAPRPTVKPQ